MPWLSGSHRPLDQGSPAPGSVCLADHPWRGGPRPSIAASPYLPLPDGPPVPRVVCWPQPAHTSPGRGSCCRLSQGFRGTGAHSGGVAEGAPAGMGVPCRGRAHSGFLGPMAARAGGQGGEFTLPRGLAEGPSLLPPAGPQPKGQQGRCCPGPRSRGPTLGPASCQVKLACGNMALSPTGTPGYLPGWPLQEKWSNWCEIRLPLR